MHYHGKKISKLQFLSSIEQFVNICLYFCDFFTLGSCLSNPPFILILSQKNTEVVVQGFLTNYLALIQAFYKNNSYQQSLNNCSQVQIITPSNGHMPDW